MQNKQQSNEKLNGQLTKRRTSLFINKEILQNIAILQKNARINWRVRSVHPQGFSSCEGLVPLY